MFDIVWHIHQPYESVFVFNQPWVNMISVGVLCHQQLINCVLLNSYYYDTIYSMHTVQTQRINTAKPITKLTYIK